MRYIVFPAFYILTFNIKDKFMERSYARDLFPHQKTNTKISVVVTPFFKGVDFVVM